MPVAGISAFVIQAQHTGINGDSHGRAGTSTLGCLGGWLPYEGKLLMRMADLEQPGTVLTRRTLLQMTDLAFEIDKTGQDTVDRAN